MDFVGYSLIASVQKFLVERVEDEDVTELTTPVWTFSNLGKDHVDYADDFLIAPWPAVSCREG